MKAFRDFMLEGGFSDFVIQLALRDIDAEPLARALVDQEGDVRDIIFRNMSKRACLLLREDMRDLEGLAPEAIRAGQALYSSLLEKHQRFVDEHGFEAAKEKARSPTPPPIDLSSRQAIISTLTSLAFFVRETGLLGLEGFLEEGDGDQMFRRGLIMLMEGWDPLVTRSILGNYKASILRAKEIECDLLIAGIESLAAKDNPVVMEEKLRSLVAGL
ncbi:MAG: FliG C-terminal domain-containing protein [Spirochaetota bacterium]